MKARIDTFFTPYGESTQAIILFTAKEFPCNANCIGIFTMRESHGEASQEYVDEQCRKPKTDEEKLECKNLLVYYRQYVKSLP